MIGKTRLAAAFVLAAALGAPASADTFMFVFNGGGINGSVQLTYAANPKAGAPLGTSPNIFDPIGSYIVTGATGSFADATTGINSAITGTVLSSPGNPEPTNLLAPASFGHFIVANGVPGPGGLAPGFSYDNLFYPAGAPQTASDYPGAGGVFDIYGVVFTLADGNFVNFWSDGDFGGGPTYGAGITDGKDVLNYVFDGIDVTAVPEPATWAMMIGGFALAGAALRRRRLAVRFA